MRQRRIERLLLKADAAIDAQAIEEARAAVEEIETLDPVAAGLAERRARLESLLTDPAIPDPPDMLAAPAFLDLELRSPVDEDARAPGRARVWLGRAAAAVLVLGAIGWFAVRRDLARPILAMMSRSFTSPSVVNAPETQTETPSEAPGATPAPLPPVQVAVEEVAPAVAGAGPTVDPASATLATAGTEVPPPVRAEEPASARSEPPPSAPPAPITEVRAPPPPAPELRPSPATAAVYIPSTPTLERAAVSSLPTSPAPVQPLVPPPPVNAATDVSAPPARESSAALDAAPTRNANTNPAPGGAAAEEVRIRSVLSQYESAYSRLDVDSASAVFPGIDRRALARAFEGLSSQQVSLGACDVRLIGDIATAECTGTARWTPKVGGGTHNQQRRWMFRLRNMTGGWRIVGATVASR